MTLLAIILAFAVFHWVEKPKGLHSFDYLSVLNDFLNKSVHVSVPQVRFVFLLLLPLLTLALVLELLHVDGLHGHSVGFLLVHVLVLFYLLGPSAMDNDLAENQLLDQLNLSASSTPDEVIHGMTHAALKRWFGVLFWYLILGLWGALIYRLCERIEQQCQDDEVVSNWAACLRVILEFPVVILMTVALAVSADFDQVWAKCKPYFNWDTVQDLKAQFLYDAVLVSVKHTETIEATDAKEEDEEAANTSDEGHGVVNDTLYLLKRMLVACLVFVALLVLFSVR